MDYPQLYAAAEKEILTRTLIGGAFACGIALLFSIALIINLRAQRKSGGKFSRILVIAHLAGMVFGTATFGHSAFMIFGQPFLAEGTVARKWISNNRATPMIAVTVKGAHYLTKQGLSAHALPDIGPELAVALSHELYEKIEAKEKLSLVMLPQNTLFGIFRPGEKLQD